MPSVTLHARGSPSIQSHNTIPNKLPTLLQTPSGLALLEIQGTIHAPFPQANSENSLSHPENQDLTRTPIGRLEFPLYDPAADASDLKWMKRVYLYVGKNQRLTGEVKKLPKPLVVVGKRTETVNNHQMLVDRPEDKVGEELEILEIVKHKILFGGRPEPVSN